MDTRTSVGERTLAIELADQISAWLRDQLEWSGADRFVLGLSGGIDSAVVAGLAARAVGSDRVFAVMMPAASNPSDLESAALVAQAFGIPATTIDLTAPTQSLRAVLPSAPDVQERLGLPSAPPAEAVQLADANIKPRLRMATLYYVANLCRGIVLGTGNKTEAMIGYFTKYGDGGVDLLPIVDLYKREVREVARAIGVPQQVIERPPSAGLWQGQTDEDEIGITYDELDRTLEGIESGDTRDADPATVERVMQMVASSEHKRQRIPRFSRD
ncbi:MAG TPA: NAD+ synthase [Thermomicrobiales bacterium]|nr:NAD+ synthase [Thermomicrobiales bacterium]